VKVAVSVIAEFIVIFAGFVVPVKLPVPLPVQDLNLWPAFAVALIVTVAPALFQPLIGVTVPGPLVCMVRKYWCWNEKTMVVDEAVPVNVCVEYQRWLEVDPVSGFGETDQVDPASTDTALGVFVSGNDFDTPLST
jgi:hypothetical protein